ncbi:MAG TPA: histidine phosphatase family protein [Gammaproteobacteria bacterium]|nr:histidine phosphatase family protein [Gammaproteobacteria bacterium]
MILYLVRHAKSSWAERGISDHARPLNSRGLRDAPRMFERLYAHAPAPQLIVTSDAARAKATASVLATTLGYSAEQLQLDKGLYHADPERIASRARALPDSAAVAALVGHNPGMTYAANKLAGNLELDNLPTCGIVGIHFDGASWSELTTGVLCYFDYPKYSDGPLVRIPDSP